MGEEQVRQDTVTKIKQETEGNMNNKYKNTGNLTAELE